MGRQQQRWLAVGAEEVRGGLALAERPELCPVCQLPMIVLIRGKRQCRNCGYIES